MNTYDELSDKIVMGIYGKPGNPDAPENQGDDFKAGYSVGQNISSEDDAMNCITREWIRIGKPETLPDSFMEWKRGMWAAVLGTVMEKSKLESDTSSSTHQGK